MNQCPSLNCIKVQPYIFPMLGLCCFLFVFFFFVFFFFFFFFFFFLQGTGIKKPDYCVLKTIIENYVLRVDFEGIHAITYYYINPFMSSVLQKGHWRTM